MYYDKNGKPIDDVLAWAELLRNPEYQIVKQTRIGKYFISSVWLGLDHFFRGPSPFSSGTAPLIFETMIFADGTNLVAAMRPSFFAFADETEKHTVDPFDLQRWRYSTQQETLEHHNQLVAEVTATAEASCKCEQLLTGHNVDCYFSQKNR